MDWDNFVGKDRGGVRFGLGYGYVRESWDVLFWGGWIIGGDCVLFSLYVGKDDVYRGCYDSIGSVVFVFGRGI